MNKVKKEQLWYTRYRDTDNTYHSLCANKKSVHKVKKGQYILLDWLKCEPFHKVLDVSIYGKPVKVAGLLKAWYIHLGDGPYIVADFPSSTATTMAPKPSRRSVINDWWY